ncbi:MAG: hypothetical protein PHV99_00415 [Candidatus Pacebacteria bacterium]|nr:hypothetical protein [Candidatus Paceibacterota bacterium]
MDQLEQLRKEVEAIRTRNSRVEADKAWEVSAFRKILILLTTYVLASLTMYAMGVPNFYLSSLIPALGFFLSTLTFPAVKKWWIRRFLMNPGVSDDI